MVMSSAAYRRAIEKKNEGFFQSMISAIHKSGKVVAGTMAAEALITAMNNTKHDSSRAAANWEINVGGVNPVGHDPTVLNPEKYEDASAAIGTRHSEGAFKGRAIGRKKVRYGIKGKAGQDVTLGENGWLWRALEIGLSREKPEIILWSALGDSKQVKYRKNAFPEGVDLKAIIAYSPVKTGLKKVAVDAIKKALNKK